MPLVLDPARYSPEQLRALLVELREGLAEYREMIQNPSATVREPQSLRTAADLLDDTMAAVDRLGSSTADRAELAAVVNLSYSVMLSAIDLWKSHVAVSKVPKAAAHSPP
jgi:hypothetical protein